MLGIFRNFLDSNERAVKQLQSVVDGVNQLEPAIAKLKMADFAPQVLKYKSRLNNGETLDDILPEFFALVREASVRTLKMRLFEGTKHNHKTQAGKSREQNIHGLNVHKVKNQPHKNRCQPEHKTS